MDDDKNRKLNMEEFRKGVEEYGLSFTKAEIEDLFRIMDLDKSGYIDYEEFLRQLRVNPLVSMCSFACALIFSLQ